MFKTVLGEGNDDFQSWLQATVIADRAKQAINWDHNALEWRGWTNKL